MKKIFLSLFLSCLMYAGYGQKEGNIWYFGFHAGLDFNYTPPVSIMGVSYAPEGCSSIADPVTGQLLFYTNGATVWDRNHSPMPVCTTTSLNGHYHSSQNAVIVPQPGSNSLYYIFTTAAQAGWVGDYAAMCYSIVDLNLNGGNGDLSSVNNVIMDSTTEKIAVIGDCDRSFFWIVAHRWNCDSFYAYKLTASGLAAPVKSKTGLVHDDAGNIPGGGLGAVGYMKFSSDGRKLGVVVSGDISKIELLDFDINTGIVSNPVNDALPIPWPYGCSFSPDNSKFYVSSGPKENSPSALYQYDMHAGSAAAIVASRRLIAISDSTTSFYIGALQNGPDGKMYAASPGNASYFVHVIHNPNETGAACNFTVAGQALWGSASAGGLPAMAENFLSPVTPKFNLPQPLTICNGNTVSATQYTPRFTITPATGVTFNDDSTVVTFSPAVTTTYTAVTSSNCAPNDTVVFTVHIAGPVADFVFNPADPGPADLQLTLDNQSTNASFYTWYDANNRVLSSAIDYIMPHPGLGNFCYALVAKDSVGCADSITKCIAIDKYSIVFIPNTFSPNGDGINDEFRIYGPYRQLEGFSVFNRYGTRIFHTNDRSRGWNGMYNEKLCDAGTYHYLIRFVNGKGEKEIRKGDITLLR